MKKSSLKILDIKDTCTGCGACVSSCSKGALQLEYDAEGFYFPVHNATRCIDCNLCEKACHILNTEHLDAPSRDYTPYMVKAKSQDVVKASSSGGVFSILAERTLAMGGVVYGARYNYDTERLEHSSTDLHPLDEFRKSKYFESYIGTTFQEVALQLKKERQVLFVGTPCHVSALHHYLETKKVSTEKLILARFICHGVPSNRFFTEYKHWIENKVGSRLKHFDFRPKTRGWRVSNILLQFNNGKVIDELYPSNYFYFYFQKNFTLRRSCYNCKKLFNEDADITMADFWGIHKYAPENADNEGVSLLLLHSDKARALFNETRDNFTSEELPQSAVDYIYKDTADKEIQFEDRNIKMSQIIKMGYMNHARKHFGNLIIKNKLKDFLRKLRDKFKNQNK